MPRIDYNTKADFDRTYNLGAEGKWGHPGSRPEIRLGYHRVVMGRALRRKGQAYNRLFGLDSRSNIAVVGAGFGWTVPDMYGNAICTDTSDYVESVKNTCECSDIKDAVRVVGLDPNEGEGLERYRMIRDLGPRCKCESGDPQIARCGVVLHRENLLTEKSRSDLITRTATPDIIITEMVLSCLEDAEIVDFHNKLLQMGATEVIHHVAHLYPNDELKRDPIFNWKTIRQFKELLPGVRFINSRLRIV